MFTDEELEKLVGKYRIDGEVNQEIIKRIHLMFGGDYHEKDNYEYNYVRIRLYTGLMYIVYNEASETFIFAEPGSSPQHINHWKLKTLLENITKALKKDKENKLKMKLKKIEKDFV
jgi:hypothetical protein